jgi:hypothetical protein
MIRTSARRIAIPSAALDRYIADGGWRAARPTSDTSSFKWLEREYFTACRAAPAKRMRKLKTF